MKSIIIGNGSIKNTQILKDEIKCNDIIICSDGGARYAFEEGIVPHYIIGDLDSTPMQIIEFFRTRNVEFKKYNPRKDETDMELAINFAISLGVSEIVILGGIGTRLDHTMTNINLLMKALDANVLAYMKDDNNLITLIDNELTLEGEKGDIVSLIPLSNEVLGIDTKGLEYHLVDGTMSIGNSLGVSNIMMGNEVYISIKKGYLLVMKTND